MNNSARHHMLEMEREKSLCFRESADGDIIVEPAPTKIPQSNLPSAQFIPEEKPFGVKKSKTAPFILSSALESARTQSSEGGHGENTSRNEAVPSASSMDNRTTSDVMTLLTSETSRSSDSRPRRVKVVTELQRLRFASQAMSADTVLIRAQPRAPVKRTPIAAPRYLKARATASMPQPVKVDKEAPQARAVTPLAEQAVSSQDDVPLAEPEVMQYVSAI